MGELAAKAEAPELRRCPWCSNDFEPKRRDQAYCSTGCNDKAFALMLKRAVRLYRAAYHWRLWWAGKGRLDVARNFRFVCAEIGAWIREDREMQRLPPPPHDHDSNRGHERKPRPVQLRRRAGKSQ